MARVRRPAAKKKAVPKRKKSGTAAKISAVKKAFGTLKKKLFTADGKLRLLSGR